MPAKKRGRPKRKAEVREPFNVLLLEHEKAELLDAARKDERSLSRWIVMAALRQARWEAK